MKRACAICIAIVLILAGTAAMLQAGGKKYKRMAPGTFVLKSKAGIDYVLTVPKSYNPKTGAPFMLCIHGDAGFRDMNDFKGVWSGWMNTAGTLGFVCCAPKAPSRNWVGKASSLLRLVDELKERFNLRVREHVAVGHSSGATAAFQIALADPLRFSAFGSMGGRLQVNQQKVKQAKNMGAFLSHITGDNVVPPSASKQAADALKAAGVTVKHEEMAGQGHAMEYYLNCASASMIKWLVNWVKNKARLLTDPGDDTNLTWEGTEGFFEKLKEEKKAGLVYLYSKKKDRKSKTAQWLRWEVFPNDDFKELAGELICVKVEYDSDENKDFVKALRVKSCALLVVNASKKVVKKYTKPRDMSKFLKEVKKAKEKVEKAK